MTGEGPPPADPRASGPPGATPTSGASPGRGLYDAAMDRAIAFARGLDRDTWVALGVLAVALLLRLNHLADPADNYDEGSYVASLRLMAHGAPLYGAISHGQPPLFLLGLYPWFVALGGTLSAARLGVVAYSLLGLGAAWWIGRAFGGPRVALVALTLLAFDPLYLTQSRAVQAEVSSLAWALVALAAAVWYARRPARWLALLAGAALVAACLTKLAGALAIVPVLAYLLRPAWAAPLAAIMQARRWPSRAQWGTLWRAARPTLAWTAVGAGIAALVALLPVAGNLGAMWRQVFAIRVVAEHIPGFARSNNPGLIASAWWEAPLLAVAILVAIHGWRHRRWDAIVLALWAGISLLALCLQSPLFAHHLALAVPPLVLLAAIAPGDLALPGLRRLAGPALSGALVALVLLVSFATDIVQLSDQAAHLPNTALLAALDLNSLTLPSDLVITDDPIIAVFAGRDVPPNLADTSQVRIAAGMLTARDVEAAARDPHVTAILWYSGRFDLLPGLRAWIDAHYMKVIDYGGGRNLYVRGAPSLPVGLEGSHAR